MQIPSKHGKFSSEDLTHVKLFIIMGYSLLQLMIFLNNLETLCRKKSDLHC